MPAHTQEYAEFEPQCAAHLALLKQTKLRMEDAVHTMLLASAEAYSQSMEGFMVRGWAVNGMYGARECMRLMRGSMTFFIRVPYATGGRVHTGVS